MLDPIMDMVVPGMAEDGIVVVVAILVPDALLITMAIGMLDWCTI